MGEEQAPGLTGRVRVMGKGQGPEGNLWIISSCY